MFFFFKNSFEGTVSLAQIGLKVVWLDSPWLGLERVEGEAVKNFETLSNIEM